MDVIHCPAVIEILQVEKLDLVVQFMKVLQELSLASRRVCDVP